MSGRLWERQRLRRYYLQRWPSRRAMKRVRGRVRLLTPRGRCHADMRGVIAQLNPILRGWGQYFRSGNASRQFNMVDSYVVRRLKQLRQKRKGRNLQAGEAQKWNAASRPTTGKPCAGNPHARFERGRWFANRPLALLTTNVYQ